MFALTQGFLIFIQVNTLYDSYTEKGIDFFYWANSLPLGISPTVLLPEKQVTVTAIQKY